jgi:superfamily II DNA helicase RecQ
MNCGGQQVVSNSAFRILVIDNFGRQAWEFGVLRSEAARKLSPGLSPRLYTPVAMDADDKLMPALRRYWGYGAFRPLQERVISSLLGGHDACVVMPTGGGKSLCYQLPAAVCETRTVIVVSPLIALMHDQVAQLTAMGIPAAFLNSSLPHGAQAEIMLRAARGEYRRSGWRGRTR